MASARAGRVYLGRTRTLNRRVFLRHIRYLERDGRHTALYVWNQTSLEHEIELLATLLLEPSSIYATTFVASFGTKNLNATDALNALQNALTASNADVVAGVLIAHGLPREDTMRHVHVVLASTQPLNVRAIYAILQRHHSERYPSDRTNVHESDHSQRHGDDALPDVLGSRKSASRLAAMEDQRGLTTFRLHAREQIGAAIGTANDYRTWNDLHALFAPKGFAYTLDGFGNGIIASSDRRWRVAASLVDPALAAPRLGSRLGPFRASEVPAGTSTYQGPTRSDRFSPDQWAGHDAARARYRAIVEPALQSELTAVDRTYRERNGELARARAQLRERVRATVDMANQPLHYDTIEWMTRRARERIKATWLAERADVYDHHERAPDRAIGRWISHRPPSDPPPTTYAAIAASGAVGIATPDGTDYYRHGVRVATDVGGQLWATAPEAFGLDVALGRTVAPPQPVPPLVISGPHEKVALLRARFRPALELDDALLYEPASLAKRDEIEQAAAGMGLRLADPYALARLERDGRPPQEATLPAQPTRAPRPQIPTRERRRHR